MSDDVMFDGIEFPGVETPPKQLPGAWRLLRIGANPLTKEGKPFELRISREDVLAMADFAREKGGKIPIDSRHALFALAEHEGVEEEEVRRMLPHRCAALGFAALEARDDGLWAADVEWLPLAAEMVRNGFFRYFSPVIRGMSPGGVLRISSIALDNVPALNNLDVIAAGDHVENQQGKGEDMPNLTEALQKLLGDEALALGDAQQTQAVADKLLALADELPGLRERAARAEALQLAAEHAERDKIIERGLAAGKFCKAQRAVLEKLPLADLVALEAVGRAGSAVPVSVEPLYAGDGEEREEEPLSAPERAVARSLNLSEEEFRKAKTQTQHKED